MEGKIKVLKEGYGFISSEGQAKDTFFHANDLENDIQFNDLREGDTLSFEVEQGDNGKMQAVRVSLVEDAGE